MRKFIHRLALFSFLTFLVGCASQFKNKIDFNPSEPLRVAVLPFSQVNERGEIVDLDSDLLVDEIPLLSSKLGQSPASYVQGLVQHELIKTGLDVVSPSVVENKLSHSGFETDNKLDLKRIFATAPKEMCQLLSCDALIYGKVTEWSRSYYAIQSVNTVGIELRLVSARNGRELFVSQAKDSDSRGLTKGPTGFSSVVLEPIRGLDNEIIVKLAARTVAQMLSPLFVENRQDFLNTEPPAVLGSAHDALDGEIKRDKSLTVVMLGTPNRVATFSIGSVVENVPMVEKDKGHYIGEFFPLPSDRFSEQPVFVALTDEFGRVTKQKLGFKPINLR